jgi:hypothetical protein
MNVIQRRPTEPTSPDFVPVRMDEIEIGRPLPALPSEDPRTGTSFASSLCLVRLHGKPLGLVQVDLPPTGLPADALAARAGATVLMGFGLYEGGARYRIEFVACGPAAAAASRGAALRPVVDRYVAILESYARRYPKNWFNFFPYWEQR